MGQNRGLEAFRSQLGAAPGPRRAPHLEQDEELEDAAEGGREEPRVGHCHLEEERVEQAVADVDERVLVAGGVPHAAPVPPGGPAVGGRVLVRGVGRVVLGHRGPERGGLGGGGGPRGAPR